MTDGRLPENELADGETEALAKCSATIVVILL